MQLNISQIREITLGAARVEEREDGVHFYRFTEEQEALYQARKEDFYLKTFATSGVQLAFETDSETLFLRAITFPRSSSRHYFAFDILVNGEKVDSLHNLPAGEPRDEYLGIELPMGECSKRVSLGSGVKKVQIYLPWSIRIALQELTLDEGAVIRPVKPTYQMLCFGDSITHGYDALCPSHKYITRLAMFLDAEEHNKAIGGEIFFPDLADTQEDFEPDYITVAYGTNDWSKCTQEEFTANCSAFFERLCRRYPHAKIFAITPIWRKDADRPNRTWDLTQVKDTIFRQAERWDNLVAIDGSHLVPPDEMVYADRRLHPNDAGFDHYFKNLAKAIAPVMEDIFSR